MAEVIVITSGKGGVGKTTTAANFASALAQRNYKTVVIDFDVGLRNLDLLMGCERRIIFDLVNVINDGIKLHQALIRDKRLPNLSILPASQTRDKDALTETGVKQILEELRDHFDFIVCDSPAGIEKGAVLAFYYADAAIIVTNPEMPSIRDSDRIIGFIEAKSQRAELGQPLKEYLLLNRYDPNRVAKEEMLDVNTIQKILDIPLLGIIPEDSKATLYASNIGEPLIFQKPISPTGQAYLDAVARYLGDNIEMVIPEPDSVWKSIKNLIKEVKSTKNIPKPRRRKM